MTHNVIQQNSILTDEHLIRHVLPIVLHFKATYFTNVKSFKFHYANNFQSINLLKSHFYDAVY